jgi:acyl-CoA reductase-like NAD-dependent aldehyde dehydrogenase
MATTELTKQQLLIAGEWTDARSGETYCQTFPFTGEQVGSPAAAGRDDARAAVDAASDAFGEWSRSAPAMRREILNKAADLMMERQQEIAGIVTEETGGVFGWGMFNVGLAAGMLREAAAQAYGLVGEVIPSDVPGKLAMGVRAPAGVVVGIAPWNAPVILGTRAVATPLAYANTVVLKASEICPRTHATIVQALADAGMPPGVINLVTNRPEDAAEVVDELIAHPATRRVSGLVDDAVQKGARALSGGRPDGPCFPPTVVADVTPEMRLYSEESFGPVVAVMPVDGVDEAVGVANDSEYGLSAAVFSQDVPAALELAQRIESGICHINDTTVHDEPQMPFGGVKASGFGRFGGRAALEEFTELRWITVQQQPRQYPTDAGRRHAGGSDDPEQDQQADGGEHTGREQVAPALEPLALDLIAAPGGREGETHDRADRDRGKDHHRPDRGRDTGGGGGQEHGQDRQVG